MPTVGTFHTFYWEFSDTVVPVASLGGRGWYPMWQASVVTPSLFGAIGAWLDTKWAQLQWWWRVCRRIDALAPPQRTVFLEVLDLLESPAYAVAHEGVTETAHTEAFTRPEAWIPYSRMIKASLGRAENVFRHVKAGEYVKAHAGSTFTNPTLNLLVELAYHQYAAHPPRSSSHWVVTPRPL